MSDQPQLNISRLDPALKERLVAEAADSGMSLNDYAVGILAERFHVRFVGTGRPSTGANPAVARLMLPVSEQLYRKFKVEAARTGLSIVTLSDRVFRDHFAALDTTRVA